MSVMERGSTEKGTAAAESGRIEGIEVAELLWELGAQAYSGSVIFERGEVRKILYYREGRVVFAASTEVEDRLGHFLLKRGEVRLPPLIEAGSDVARGRRLGQILIDRGTMDPAAIVRAVMDQVREIALSVFPWRDGTWRLCKAKLPAEESITLDLPMGDLVLAGVRRVRGWSRIRSAVGGSRAVYERTDASAPDYASFGMTERAILERLEGPARVDQICRDVYAPSYAVYRALWALSILGLVRRLDPHPVQESLAGPGEGLIGPLGVSDLLLDLGDREFTGVLRLFHPSGMEGALHLSRGRVDFATTSDMELSLSGHLLRRGIISEQDHEQAERLLISGKRLGTILAESGALSEDELVRFVREQVLEVACQLLCWREGEYRIEESLPSEESITLTLPVEDAVMSAHETSESFARVWEGVGGLESVYRLEPDYLERLDRMTLRPAVWEIVTLLSQERSIEELLAIRTEPDFEVCRLIHALERTRVIARVPAEERADDASRGVFGHVGTPHDLLEEAAHEDAAGAPAEAHDSGEELPATPGATPTAAGLAPELFQEVEGAAPPSFDEMESEEEVPEAEESALKVEDALEAPVEPEPESEVDILTRLGESAPEPVLYDSPESVDEAAAEPESLIREEESLQEPEAPLADEPESARIDDEVATESGEAAPPSGHETMRLDRSDFASFISMPEGDESSEDDGASQAETLAESLQAEHAEANIERDDEPRDEPVPAWDHEPASEPELEAEPEPEAGVDAEAAEPPEALPPADAAAKPGDDAPEIADSEASGEPSTKDEPCAETPVVEGPWSLDDPTSSESVEDEGFEEAPEEETPASAVETTLEMPASAGFELDEPGAIPQEIRDAVARFNKRHAALFARLKLEVGSGALNFVRTCRSSLGASASLFADFEPDRDGIFDPDALERRLADAGAESDAFERVEALIQEELAMMRYLLDKTRLAEIETELGEL